VQEKGTDENQISERRKAPLKKKKRHDTGAAPIQGHPNIGGRECRL
jgi:hypothetical protein